MMKFPSTFDDESLLTYEVSDEALETAGGKEIAANFTLGPARAWLNAPLDQFGLSNSKDWRHPCQTAS
jgi:hypothetical protein